MISTLNIIRSVFDVPETFIFERYLNLQEQLIGQEVTLCSIFNQETRPSFTLFFDHKAKRYYFKCFSSGKGGSAVDLLREMFPDKPKAKLYAEVIEEYQNFLKGNPEHQTEFKQFYKFKVSSYALRRWNSSDKKYWTAYHIGSKDLEYFNIAPLESFCMSKPEGEGTKTITIRRDLIYAFFRKTGDIFKIYQPENKDCRFIKVRSGYLAGADQLRYASPQLIITKSLKDCVGFHILNIPGWEIISCESENQMITKQQMNTLNFYKRKVVLFDSDKPGRAAAEKYTETYGIPYVDLGMEKDITDSLKATSVEKVKSKLLKLLQ